MSQLCLQVVNYLAKTYTSDDLVKALNQIGLKVTTTSPTGTSINKNFPKVQCSDGVEVYVTNQWTYEHLDVFKIVLKKLNPPILID
jgi:broad specificity polyphosphatase/5'/3'-nucleotidase SurE